MTNKQYEHLGRAVCIEAELERKHAALEDDIRELAKELCATGAGPEAASKWVTEHYGQTMAAFHNPRYFMDAVRSLLAMDATRGGEEARSSQQHTKD